jgi:hypothetical protein
MKSVFSTAALLAVALTSAGALAQSGPVVHTARGDVLGAPDGTVTVNGRVVFRDPDGGVVLPQGPYQEGSRVYVLLAEHSGGNACPTMWRVLDLSGAKPVVSNSFGNCSEAATAGASGGSLVITQPKPPVGAAAVFVYQDGRVSKR